MIYPVTYILLEQEEIIGARTCGWFPTSGEAESAVTETKERFQEHFNYAVIEEVPEGFKPVATVISSYMWDRHVQKWISCPLPDKLSKYSNFAMG